MDQQDEIPLVIAPNDGSEGGGGGDTFTLFAYTEKQADTSGTSSTSDPTRNPRLIRRYLSHVPPELKDYVVYYKRVKPQTHEQKPIGADQPTRDEVTNTNTKPCILSLTALPSHLRNLTVLHSTGAGTRSSSAVYFSVLAPLLQAFDLPHVYVSTTSPSTISSHAASFSSSSTVIFLSGDTSIHEFINSLDATQKPLSLNVMAIPTGTGNALSSSIGIKSVAQAISRLFVGKAEPLSTCRVEFPQNSVVHTFHSLPLQVTSLQSIVVTSWAFHAALVADSDSEEYRKFGASRFAKAAQENIALDQAYHGKINTKTLSLDGPHSYVLFTTVTNLEKTFKISPKSQPPGDLNVSLVQFDHLPGSAIMDIMKSVYDNSRHVNDPRVLYKQIPISPTDEPVAVLTITEPDWKKRRFCIDGLIVIAGGMDSTSESLQVKIYTPKQSYKGWNLFVIV